MTRHDDQEGVAAQGLAHRARQPARPEPIGDLAVRQRRARPESCARPRRRADGNRGTRRHVERERGEVLVLAAQQRGDGPHGPTRSRPAAASPGRPDEAAATRARVSASRPSGSCTPTMPPGPQAMAHRPMVVSKRAKPGRLGDDEMLAPAWPPASRRLAVKSRRTRRSSSVARSSRPLSHRVGKYPGSPQSTWRTHDEDGSDSSGGRGADGDACVLEQPVAGGPPPKGIELTPLGVYPDAEVLFDEARGRDQRVRPGDQARVRDLRRGAQGRHRRPLRSVQSRRCSTHRPDTVGRGRPLHQRGGARWRAGGGIPAGRGRHGQGIVAFFDDRRRPDSGGDGRGAARHADLHAQRRVPARRQRRPAESGLRRSTRRAASA